MTVVSWSGARTVTFPWNSASETLGRVQARLPLADLSSGSLLRIGGVMSRATRSFGLSFLPLAFVLAVPGQVQAQVSVEGAWTVSEWAIDGETTAAQPGIFLFTSTHYSIFFVNQPEERDTPAQTGPGGMTDAEKIVAYDEFTANAGRYTIDGNTLTTRAYLAKNPGYMAGWPDNEVEYTVHRDGDTLTLTFGSGNTATLIRREGQSPG